MAVVEKIECSFPTLKGHSPFYSRPSAYERPADIGAVTLNGIALPNVTISSVHGSGMSIAITLRAMGSVLAGSNRATVSQRRAPALARAPTGKPLLRRMARDG